MFFRRKCLRFAAFYEISTIKYTNGKMKRKDYRKPTMKVVKLHHTGMLMTSGPVGAKGAQKQDYESEEW